MVTTSGSKHNLLFLYQITLNMAHLFQHIFINKKFFFHLLKNRFVDSESYKIVRFYGFEALDLHIIDKRSEL